MKLTHLKGAIVAAWLLAMFVVSVAADVTSGSAWAVLAGFALLPPLVMLRWWKDPPQTLSESINKARS
jgi:hypothetical protein